MGKKRKNKAHHYKSSSAPRETPAAPPPLPTLDVPSFDLTAIAAGDAMSISPPPYRAPDEADEGEWEQPGRNKKPKKEKSETARNYPEFSVSPQKLRRHVQLHDLQSLILWLLADAAGPQWLLVRVSACRGMTVAFRQS